MWYGRYPEGHWLWNLEGVGYAALETPFSRLPVVHKGPIWALNPFTKVQFQAIFSSQGPVWEKMDNLVSTTSIFSSQAPNLEIFSSQDPLFWGNDQFTSPTLWKSGPHTLTWNKLSASPQGQIIIFYVSQKDFRCRFLLSIYWQAIKVSRN